MISRLALLLLVAFSLIALEGCATTQASTAQKHKRKRVKSKGAATGPIVAAPGGDVASDGSDDDLEGEEGEDDESLASVIMSEGGASFYHDSLAGRLTANGEKYNPEAKTCAHKSLPFGTVVIVEDTDSGKWTRCRINDRGPYVAGRIIDLSKRTARDLGIIDKGVTNVRIRVARPAAS